MSKTAVKKTSKQSRQPSAEDIREMKLHFRSQTAEGLGLAVEVAKIVFDDTSIETVFSVFDLFDFDDEGNAPSEGAIAQLVADLNEAKKMANETISSTKIEAVLGVYERAFADYDDDEDEDENE